MFDRGLYRLTLQVTKVTGSAFTVKGTFQNKFAKELNLDCGRVSYLSPSGGKTKTVTTKSNSFTYTASMADLALGCNYLKFSVEALGGNTYVSYRSTECLYFNILPGNYTLALNNAKANRERITLFKAFNGGKNTIVCESSFIDILNLTFDCFFCLLKPKVLFYTIW